MRCCSLIDLLLSSRKRLTSDDPCVFLSCHGAFALKLEGALYTERLDRTGKKNGPGLGGGPSGGALGTAVQRWMMFVLPAMAQQAVAHERQALPRDNAKSDGGIMTLTRFPSPSGPRQASSCWCQEDFKSLGSVACWQPSAHRTSRWLETGDGRWSESVTFEVEWADLNGGSALHGQQNRCTQWWLIDLACLSAMDESFLFPDPSPRNLVASMDEEGSERVRGIFLHSNRRIRFCPGS